MKGGQFDTDRLQETQPLVAMPHLDTNGNEEYDFVDTGGSEDGPYVAGGNAVVDLGFAVIGGDGGGGDGGNGGGWIGGLFGSDGPSVGR